MSLDTVPKTNFESDDGMSFTDANEIGANLQALEDSKYQEGDNVTLGTINGGDTVIEDLTAEDITSDSVTTGPLSATTGTFSGAVNPALTVATSQVVSAGTSWVPARGLYIVSFNGANLTLQINVSGWKDVNSITDGGAFPTDGTNVRVNNATGGDLTAFYQKY